MITGGKKRQKNKAQKAKPPGERHKEKENVKQQGLKRALNV